VVSAGAHAGGAASSQQPQGVPGELIVGFQPHASQSAQNAALAEVGAARGRSFSQIGAALVHPRGNAAAAAQALLRNPNVRYVQPNFVYSLEATPDDPSFGQLWGLHNTGQSGGTPDADIDAPEAWDLETGDPGVVVAVADTGVDFSHPDLAARRWVNVGENCGSLDASAPCDQRTNGVDDDANGYVDDWRGWDFVNGDNNPADDHYHGTHVAGTIGAVGNNGVGVVGVAWDVRIMGLKFLNASGNGTTANAIAATLYAADEGARISNNSWGGGGFDQALLDAIEYGAGKGMLFVAAAGNDGRDNEQTPTYPASYASDAIVAVAATDRNDVRASFSNYGRASVDLGAPGASIYSTFPGNAYLSLSGTSMATPHVSGAAALVAAHMPDATLYGLKALLLRSVDPNASLAARTSTGGRLNVAGALACSNAPKVWLSAPGNGFRVAIGEAMTIRVIGANCAAPAGVENVSVDVNGSPVTITASGTDTGVYVGQYTPTADGALTVEASVTIGANTASESVSGTAVRPPAGPLPTLDDFNRPNENPLSDSGRWANGVIGAVETGLFVTSNTLACTRTTTCTAWRSNAQYGPDVEVWTRVPTLLGDNNHIRLKARVQQPGSSAYDGYMLRTNQLPGTDQVWLERVDNGLIVTRLTLHRELAAGDLLLFRVEGTTLEAWHHDGAAWSRIGSVQDATYAGAGYVGVGLRGTTGRLDDFGARTTSQNPPGAPTSLSALAGDGSVSLAWQAPTYDGGAPVSGYRLYRGTAPGGESFLASVTGTSFQDTGLANDTTYYYRVSAENTLGEGALSTGASATPTDLVPPSEPLPTLDDFNRPNENPLSDSGRWANGVIGAVETGLFVTSNTLACTRTTTCTAWRSNAQYGPDVEVWTRVPTLLGDNNHIRLKARVQQPGSSAYDGYMLRTNQLPGTDQVWLERVDNGLIVTRLTLHRELAAGDLLLFRVEGTTLEAWHHDGAAWSRIGSVQDATYAGAGYVGVGLRGTTGRLDDFGARTMIAPPPLLAITTSSLAGGTANAAYSQAVTASGGQTPYTWSVASGSLPPGLALASGTPSATISGTPTAAGTYAFTLEVADGTQTATQGYSITVGAALAITTPSLAGGTANAAYSQAVTASGGQTPYTWSVASGSLPPGLALASGTPSATISGTPTAAGTYAFTLEVADGTQTATQAFSIVVAEEPSVVAVESVTYSTEGGRANNRDLVVRVRIMNGATPVANASVTITLFRNGAVHTTRTATTAVDGRATFTFKNYRAGCYTTVVDQVVVDGATSTPETPANSHCK
jgi:subtilisin family serine protease